MVIKLKKMSSFFSRNKKSVFIIVFILFMLANFYIVWHLNSFTEFKRGKKTEVGK